MKTRRTVETTDRKRPRGGRGPKLWAYGYSDLARLLGVSEGAIRQRVARKLFDPSDMEAVCRAWRLAEEWLDPFWTPSSSPFARIHKPSDYTRRVPVEISDTLRDGDWKVG